MTEALSLPPHRPVLFTQEELGWLPWLDQGAAACDILGATVSLDDRSSGEAAADMPRAEQALCAAATARFNGCFFCASVHARVASHLSGRPADLQRLLDQGVAADLGPRWNTIVAATAALSATPSLFGPEHVRRLRRVGLGDAAIADLVDSVALSSEANRLTLSLGEAKAFCDVPGSVGIAGTRRTEEFE